MKKSLSSLIYYVNKVNVSSTSITPIIDSYSHVFQVSVSWSVYVYSFMSEFVSVLHSNDHTHDFVSSLQQPKNNRINLQNNSPYTV